MEVIIRASKWAMGGERLQGGLRLSPIRAFMDDMTTITGPCTRLIKLNSNLEWVRKKLKPSLGAPYWWMGHGSGYKNMFGLVLEVSFGGLGVKVRVGGYGLGKRKSALSRGLLQICVCHASVFRFRGDRYCAGLEADGGAISSQMCGNCRAEMRNTSDGLSEGFITFAFCGSQGWFSLCCCKLAQGQT